MDENNVYELLEDQIKRGDLNMDELQEQVELQAQRFQEQLAAKGKGGYHKLDVTMYKFNCNFNIMLRILSHKKGYTLEEHQRIIKEKPATSIQTKEVPLSKSTPIKKWTDAHSATVETKKLRAFHGEMEEHLEGDYSFAIEEHHLFDESSKLPSSVILVQGELKHSTWGNERELEFKNQLLETETINLNQKLIEEKVGMISFPQFSSTDLVMSSKGNSRQDGKCDEIILNHQVLDDIEIETHGIGIQENVDIELHDLQLMKGEINMSKSVEGCHELERQRLQDEVEEPSVLQLWVVVQKNHKAVEEFRLLMLLGGPGLIGDYVISASKADTKFVLQFLKLGDLIEVIASVFLQEHLAGIIGKVSKFVIKAWAEIITGFKGGTLTRSINQSPSQNYRIATWVNLNNGCMSLLEDVSSDQDSSFSTESNTSFTLVFYGLSGYQASMDVEMIKSVALD